MSGTVSRALPEPRLVDGTVDTESPRRNGYGEDYVMPFSRRMSVEEGSYRLLYSATPGTGVAGHAAPTTMDNTKPFVMLQAGAAKQVMLDYIKLVVTAAGTAGTLNYATGLLATSSTYTSGGADLTTSNPNGGLNEQSGLLLSKVGAVVAVAGSAERQVHHQRVRTVIPVVGDVIIFNFGTDANGSSAVLGGTTELERVIACPPVIIAPQQFYKLVLWRASQSAAASYEVEIGLWER